jgi:hypothetical protein
MKGGLEFTKDLTNIVMFCRGNEPIAKVPYAVIEATRVHGT